VLFDNTDRTKECTGDVIRSKHVVHRSRTVLITCISCTPQFPRLLKSLRILYPHEPHSVSMRLVVFDPTSSSPPPPTPPRRPPPSGCASRSCLARTHTRLPVCDELWHAMRQAPPRRDLNVLPLRKGGSEHSARRTLAPPYHLPAHAALISSLRLWISSS
jgi:hypothetical protein